MTETDRRKEMLYNVLINGIGEIGGELPVIDHRGDFPERHDPASQEEVAEWLREAADYVEEHTWEESVNNRLGLGGVSDE